MGCNDLATKAELEEIRKLLNRKLDKSEENRIVQSSVGLAVPLAVTGAVGQLSPGINEALSKAGKALGATAKNAGKIASNVAGIAANAANVFGLIADVAALAIAFKHEYVDLPFLRQRIAQQQTQIDLNFSIAIQNKQKNFAQDKIIAANKKRIEENTRIAVTNSGLILDNKQIINQNKKQIAINETRSIDNAIEITRIEQAYKADVKRVEQQLKSEYEAAIRESEIKFNNQITTIQRNFQAQVDRIQLNSSISQAITNQQIIQADATISGLRNSFAGASLDIQKIIKDKAEQKEFIKVRRRVTNNEVTGSIALRNSQQALSKGGGGTLSETESQKIDKALTEAKNATAQLTTRVKNVEDTTLNREQTQQFRQELRQDVSNDFKVILGGAGLLAAPVILNQINSNTSPSSVASATQQGICNSASGSGCLNSKIKNPLSQKMDDLLTAFNTTANAGSLKINLDILSRVTNIQSVVNSSTSGLSAINNFMRQAWQNTRLDKVLNVLNTILALHNAAMLSRNLGQTIGDVATQALSFLNIKDAENKSIDVNEFIGGTVNTWITNLIGAETYANIQSTWTSLNRIMVAAQGVVYSIQGVKNALLEAQETLGNWTAKIGNNMIIQGLFEERSFPWMNENINFRNPFSKFIQKIETTEEIVSQVNNLVSSGQEAQENFNQIFQNTNETVTASQELANNLAQFDLDKEASETTEKITNESPDINNSDLIKSETEI